MSIFDDPKDWDKIEFHCKQHPKDVRCKVLKVHLEKVTFGWFIEGKYNEAVCTIEEFRKDFEVFNERLENGFL